MAARKTEFPPFLPHARKPARIRSRSRIGAAAALFLHAFAAHAVSAPSSGESAPDTARIYDGANYSRPYVRGEVIVALKSGYSALSLPGAAAAKALGVVKELAAARHPRIQALSAGSRRLFLMRSRGAETVPALIAALRKDANVAFAEPNYIRRRLAAPDDSLFESQWGMHNVGAYPAWADADIDAPEAWNWHTGGRSLVLGVIDDGVDYAHPDLAANMWTNAAEAGGRPGVDDDGNGYVDDVHGYDFIGGDADPMPDGGQHGTHVAGIIGAVGGNRIGVAGVAWSASLAALKVFDSAGTTTDAALIDAIDYASAMGMRITNNSWGGPAYSQGLRDAIARGRALGHLFIAAAGNDSADTDSRPEYPASYDLDNIVSVAATTDADTLAVFSNRGAVTVDLGAPGQGIPSTLPGNGYGVLSGTSMAAPHVAGAAYLIWSYRDALTAGQVKEILMRSVDTLPSLAGNTVTGGRLNLAKVAAAMAPPALALKPGRILARVDPGAGAIRDLAIANEGASDLRYVLSVTNGGGWLTAASARPGSPTGLPFSDGFENGSSGNWIPVAGGAYTRTVTSSTAANGTFSFSQTGGMNSDFDGVYAPFPVGTAPGSVSFAVRAAAVDAEAGFFAMADNEGLSIVAGLGADGRIRVNGNRSRAYQAGRWYAIRFRIDWSARIFDYYLNDTLIAQGLPFRNPASSLRVIYLYNRTPGAQAWYDDIGIGNGGSAPIAGVLAPGSVAALPIEMDAAGLSEGVYSGSLLLRHNAPNAGDPIAVPCSLIVGYDRPPSVDAGPDRAADEGQALSFAVAVSDPDGDSAAVSLLNPTAGASFTAGLLAWTPGHDQAGVYDLRFRAESGRPALSDTDTVRVTVRNVDMPPVLDSIRNRAIPEGQTLSFLVSASDPDGDAVGITVPNPPAGAAFDAASRIFRWTPGHTDSGAYPVLFIAAAGGLSDSEWVRITVSDVDRPPELVPVPAQAADENQRIAFLVSASDPDGDRVTIALANPPAGSSFLSGRFEWVPGYAQSGAYLLRFVASSRGLADTLPVNIEVGEAGSGLGALRLVGVRPGTRFHFMPSGDQAGSYLGSDSVELAEPPGWYWIQASSPGFRPLRFASAIRMDAVETKRVALRPAAPRILARPETLLVDGRPWLPADSAAPALADLDLDGKEDLIAASPGSLSFLAGLDADTAGSRRFESSGRVGFDAGLRTGLVAAAFADWNADGLYDLIGGDADGRVFVSETIDTVFTGKRILVSRPGEKCHPFALDYDGDGRKDLGLWSEGRGIFFYRNEGTEASPVLSASAWELLDGDGRGLPGLEGPPAWVEPRGGAAREILAPEGGLMRRYEVRATGDGRLAIGKREAANLAGSAFACPGCRCAGTLAQGDRPRLFCFEKGKPAFVHAGRLAGDFDGDGRVDGRDYSLLSAAWGLTDGDGGWNPILNLAMDAAGQRIDVRDLGIFGDAWESEE